MEIDKLIDFLTPKDKGLLISTLVLFFPVYLVLVMYGADNFMSFDFIDRLLITLAVTVLLQFCIIFIFLIFDDDANNNFMTFLIFSGCIISVIPIIAKIICPRIGIWFPLVIVGLALAAIVLVLKLPSPTIVSIGNSKLDKAVEKKQRQKRSSNNL